MAAPTQEYPPWLTPVPTVIFDGNGVPVTTSTTVLYLPLTYYGPSIPLNPDWTYGGLTSPASTTVPSTTSGISVTTTATTTTAIPSSSTLTSSTSTATPASSPSSISLSTSFTTSLSSASSTPSTTPSSSGSHLSRGQLIGVIVASILGFIFIFIVVLLLYLCCKGRRNRDSLAEEPIFPPVRNRLDEGYEVVGQDGRTTWGEGSPRHSGEEADPFLRRSGAADPEMGGRVGVTRVPVPEPGSQSSAGSSSNQSGYGTVIERPTLNLLPSTTEELDMQRRGHILSPEELQRMDEESVLPQNADYSPLVPPPRLVDPDRAWGSPQGPDRPPFTAKSSQFSLSAYPDADEAATLLTARRVRVENLAPPRPVQPPGEGSSNRNSGGFLSSLGLGRLSWFSGSKRNSRADDDAEIGVALLPPSDMAETQTSRRTLGFGLGFDGERPVSTASARSATTAYYDAYSSQPGTPVSGGTPIAPLPRALTPSGSGAQQSGWPSSSTVAVSGAPDLPQPSQSYSTSMANIGQALSLEYDILDTPAPAPISPFASTSSMSSLRDTATGSSQGLSANPFPPGLDVLPQKSWTDESSSITTHVNHVHVPFSILSNQDTAAGIAIDVLEEEPPTAGAGWRSLAAEQGGIIGGRRTTFGQFVMTPEIASEEASLYSHLSPTHSRSTGSAPTSRRELSGSTGSGSSRPSAAGRTHSSGHSLAHSGSISSDARKRGASPAMSAFGGAGGRSRSPPALPPPPSAHFVPERAGTHRMGASLDVDEPSARGMSSSEPGSPLSQLSQLSSAPWAVGLDNNWTPTP